MSNRLPSWFKQELPDTKTVSNVQKLLDGLSLHTICESALCPNAGQCLSRNTATFLILGDTCTRHCTFCAVKKGIPSAVDESEPEHLLEAAQKLGLKYVVITSVTRDDLPDGGSSYFAEVIGLLRSSIKNVVIEVLIPDFLGSAGALKTLADAGPQVITHNMETVPCLYAEVRPEADYNRSVELISRVKELDPGAITKSGLMIGLGETKEEVIEVMSDLREAGCDLLTIGQYLQPSAHYHPVVEYIPPDEFAEYGNIGRKMGFIEVASAPLVRSSYRAVEMYEKVRGILS
ncbi:lipoyl synthase [Chloroflexota bacterium]